MPNRIWSNAANSLNKKVELQAFSSSGSPGYVRNDRSMFEVHLRVIGQLRRYGSVLNAELAPTACPIAA